MLRTTPLHPRHLALGARMVDFGGWEMPLQYSSIREEHVAVRERVGLFDVCHMGEVHLGGRGAEAAVRRLVANDPGRLAPGASLYGVMCNERAGIVDDVIVTRDAHGDGFLIVVNASRRDADIAHIHGHAGDADVDDRSDATALLALQGPRALAVLAAVCDAEPPAPFTTAAATVAGLAAVVSRTGYTGEDGVEIFVAAGDAVTLWDALLTAGASEGILPAGLGARDTLRLEAGLRLYGQDMDLSVDPFSAGLSWTVKPAPGAVGEEALARLRAEGAPERTIGLRLEGRAIPRHGQEVRAGASPAGTVTSGSFGFTVGAGIAIARVAAAQAAHPAFTVDIRGTAAPATRVPLPFRRRPAATPA